MFLVRDYNDAYLSDLGAHGTNGLPVVRGGLPLLRSTFGVRCEIESSGGPAVQLPLPVRYVAFGDPEEKRFATATEWVRISGYQDESSEFVRNPRVWVKSSYCGHDCSRQERLTRVLAPNALYPICARSASLFLPKNDVCEERGYHAYLSLSPNGVYQPYWGEGNAGFVGAPDGEEGHWVLPVSCYFSVSAGFLLAMDPTDPPMDFPFRGWSWQGFMTPDGELDGSIIISRDKWYDGRRGYCAWTGRVTARFKSDDRFHRFHGRIATFTYSRPEQPSGSPSGWMYDKIFEPLLDWLESVTLKVSLDVTEQD